MGPSVPVPCRRTPLTLSHPSRDPLTYLGTTAALVTVTLLASFAPARRATRVDPAVAIRGG